MLNEIWHIVKNDDGLRFAIAMLLRLCHLFLKTSKATSGREIILVYHAKP